MMQVSRSTKWEAGDFLPTSPTCVSIQRYRSHRLRQTHLLRAQARNGKIRSDSKNPCRFLSAKAGTDKPPPPTSYSLGPYIASASRRGWAAALAESCARSADAGAHEALDGDRRHAGVRLRGGAPLVADVVHEHVLAEALRRGEEGAAAVDLRHLLDEGRQHRAPLEHEGVDGDALARAALDLSEGFLQGPPRRRVGELRLAALHVRRRLAVGDHDDLLVAALLPAEERAGEHEGRVHVGADVGPAGGQLGQFRRAELARVEREADDVQTVARELAADERVERQRHLLGRQEAAVVEHRAAEVEEDDRGGLRRELGPPDLEVVRREPHGRAGAAALDGVHERASQVEQERVAELVALGVVGAVAPGAAARDGVAPEAIAP